MPTTETDSMAVESGLILRLGSASIDVLTDDVVGEDLAWVPDHDEDYQPSTREMASFEAVALAVESHEPVLIVGPTGCGKSELIRELAAVANRPLRRQNLHGDIRAADFVGERTIEVTDAGASHVVWRDGILVDAMRRGHWLLLDEIDAGPAHILFVLQAVLERNGRLVLPGNGGEIVVPHPNFHVFATANTLGRGDDAGLYSGTNVLNEAFLDRFGVVLQVDYPAPEAEALIVARAGMMPIAMATRMVDIAVAVREAAAKETCFCTLSTRRLIAWARKAAATRRPYYAAEISLLARLPAEDRKFVEGVVRRVFSPSERW